MTGGPRTSELGARAGGVRRDLATAPLLLSRQPKEPRRNKLPIPAPSPPGTPGGEGWGDGGTASLAKPEFFAGSPPLPPAPPPPEYRGRGEPRGDLLPVSYLARILTNT